jgi:glucosamine--fructose-6-phosphate aminotransferase (isomerizing)
MCGIFGIIDNTGLKLKDFKFLSKHSERRGKDSSGVLINNLNELSVYRSNKTITNLIKKVNFSSSRFAMGHSRQITNGYQDNQPVDKNGVWVIHNGIIVNHDILWTQSNFIRKQEIDTEIIAEIISNHLNNNGKIDAISKLVIKQCKGAVSCAVALPKLGKLCLLSNTGSLFYGSKNGAILFNSEKFPLTKLNCKNIEQVTTDGMIFDIPKISHDPFINEESQRTTNIIPSLGKIKEEELLLEYKIHSLKRCSKCILPETMPYIRFNQNGICNYCLTYKTRNQPRPIEEILKLLEPYRRLNGADCIVPFSGGRDSCYGLHLIIKELEMKPITYTYDWGMVTDLGRRNISRMSSELGVENIIIADNIAIKRNNIAMNFKAWLKKPHLGMVNILTAGDKHFFRHVETVKKETGIELNLWGVNPLEVTHFKTGFLGLPPNFEEKQVYSSGALKQSFYQWLRLKTMFKNPMYLNKSLWDTLSGEYYRSISKKNDYYHIFDYWKWDEKIINDTLINDYGWECATDTNTTWRIGDGTAAIYNYIYYTVAGFTEHDTFRSNQIREGDLSRQEALDLVNVENQPRYPNIKWYLDAINLDYNSVIPIINSIPKLYKIL